MEQIEKEMNRVYKELVITYEKYLKLINDELDELAIIAHVHGWKSTRHEAGKIYREKIESLKRLIPSDNPSHITANNK